MNCPLHFLILGSVSVLWLLGSLIEIHYFPVKDVPIPGSLGVVYSLTLVFTLREKVHIIRKCLLVVGGGLLSALIPFTGLFTAFFIGNVLGWEGEARFNDHYEYLVFGMASAIGALTFALLIKVTILSRINYYLLPLAMILCVTATLTVMASAEPPNDLSMIWLTFAWWIAFSVAICIAENTKKAVRH
jgi:hypothetical protein